MLPSASSLKDQLKALQPTQNAVQGITDFVTVISSFTNQVQAGPTGTPGILTFGNAAMVSIMMTMQPVKDNSWIPNFANAWAAGLLAGICTPGTVTDPAWIGSVVDIMTLPSATATIPNISAAKAALMSELANVGPTDDAPLPLATAIRNATLQLQFLCIGLGPQPALLPIPLPFSAQ